MSREHGKGPGPDRLQRELAAVRRKLAKESPGERRDRELRRDRETWEREHVWRNRPLAERKRLLAGTEDVDVAYDGAGYGSWYAPEGGWKARGRIVERSTRGIEVELTADLEVGSGIALPGAPPSRVMHYPRGQRLRFTLGGMHRDEPKTTFICVPAAWLPEAWPGPVDK